MAKKDSFYRFASVDSESANDKDRTIQVAFSSEAPVKRRAGPEEEAMGIAREGEQYLEVLSHDPKDVDLSALNTGYAPVLDQHDDKTQLGNVKRAKISKDKMGRAVLAFDGITDLSVDRYNQMKAKTRPQISVGYGYTRYLGDTVLEDGRTAKKIAWKPDEISSVARAADPGAGVARTAGTFHRSADDEWACIGCGEMFDRSDLDDNFECKECRCSERAKQAVEKFRLKVADAGRKYRAKGDATDFSHNDLRAKVNDQLHHDTRFKIKKGNGDVSPDYYLHDIEQHVDGSHSAIVLAEGYSKALRVFFDFDGDIVTVGEAYEVQPAKGWEATDDGTRAASDLITRDASKPYGPSSKAHYADPGYQKDGKARYPLDTKAHAKAAWSYWNKPKNQEPYTAEQKAHITAKIKSACKSFGIEISDERAHDTPHQNRGIVDFQDFSNAVQKLTPEQKMNLRSILLSPDGTGGGTPAVDEKKIREEETGKVRAIIAAERQQHETELKTRNAEIHAIADELVKEHGMKWNGPEGKVFVVGERIRALEAEICAKDRSFNNIELRREFKEKAGLLYEGARAPKNQENAAKLPEELAWRCSLRNVIRSASDAKAEAQSYLSPKGTAEREAHDEIHHRALSYPGGNESIGAGLILPINTPTRVVDPHLVKRILRSRGNISHFTRDSAAGDFGSAGALVAPQFIFPTIELLRNMPALARAGITMLTGAIGNITLPRQTSPTTPQSTPENTAMLEYDQTFDQIKFSPHRAGTFQRYSRLALLQATPDFEAIVMQDHMAQIALYIDEMGLNGSGANDQPLGIINQIGINFVAFQGSATLAYKNAVAMETAIRSQNIYDPVSFISTSVSRGTLRVTPATLTGSTVVSGSTNAIWTDADYTDDGEMIGRPAVDSQQVPNNIGVCLVGRHVVMVQWGGLAVVLDTVSRAEFDQYKLSVNTYIDFGLRHPQAVTRSDSLAVLN
jgi:HK97 family phage major capsid protein